MTPTSLLKDAHATAGGDHAAWSRLIAAFSPSIHAVAYRILGDAAAADDVTQEAAWALGRSIGRLRAQDDAGVGSWAVALGCRIALQHARTRRRRERRIRTGLGGVSAVPARSDGDDRPDPDDLDRLMDALQQLPQRQRLPIVLHFFAGLDGLALGAQLGISANAARVRLHRALRRMQQLVGSRLSAAPPSVLLIQQAARPAPAMSSSLAERLARLPLRGIAPASVATRLVLPVLLLIILGIGVGMGLGAILPVPSHAHVISMPAQRLVQFAPEHPTRVVAPSLQPAAEPPVGQDPEVPLLVDQRVILAEEGLSSVPAPIFAGEALVLTGVNHISCWDAMGQTRRWCKEITPHLGNPARFLDEIVLTRIDQVLALGLTDGGIRWSLPVGRQGMLLQGDLVVAGSRGYVASQDALWCLDLAHQGRPRWRTALPGGLPGPLRMGSRHELMVPCGYQCLVAVDGATGTIRWSLPIPGVARVVECRDGLAYALTQGVEQRVVAVQESSGAPSWQRVLPQPAAVAAPGRGGRSLAFEPPVTPVLPAEVDAGAPPAGQRPIVICSGSGIYGLRSDGVLCWSRACPVFAPREPTCDTLGRIWLGGDHGELLVVAATSGHLLLRMELDQQPALVHRQIAANLVDYRSVGALSQPLLAQGRVWVLSALGTAVSWSCAGAIAQAPDPAAAAP